MEKETRTLTAPVEMRSLENDEQEEIVGYALKFGTHSDILGGGQMRFKETIDKDALKNTNMDNVVALFNHDNNQVLGRVGVNVDLEVDDTGLRYTIKPIDTQVATDLVKNIRAGIVNQSSFGFTIAENGDEWRKSDDESYQYERTIRSFDSLFDVSVVTNPAYRDTPVTLSARSKEQIEKLNINPVLEQQKRMKFEFEKQQILNSIGK